MAKLKLKYIELVSEGKFAGYSVVTLDNNVAVGHLYKSSIDKCWSFRQIRNGLSVHYPTGKLPLPARVEASVSKVMRDKRVRPMSNKARRGLAL